jgi:hypothetical protein
MVLFRCARRVSQPPGCRSGSILSAGNLSANRSTRSGNQLTRRSCKTSTTRSITSVPVSYSRNPLRAIQTATLDALGNNAAPATVRAHIRAPQNRLLTKVPVRSCFSYARSGSANALRAAASKSRTMRATLSGSPPSMMGCRTVQSVMVAHGSARPRGCIRRL